MGSPINFHNKKFEIGSTICVIGDRSTSTSRSQLANWTPQNTGLPRAPIRKQSIGKIFLEIKTHKKRILIGFTWLRRLGSNQRPID